MAPVPAWCVPLANLAADKSGTDVKGELTKKELTKKSIVPYLFETLLKCDMDACKLSSSDEEAVTKDLEAFAYKMQSTSEKAFDAKDVPAKLAPVVKDGKSALFLTMGKSTCFQAPYLQSYLAAKQTWAMLEKGEAFPAWITAPNSFAIGAAEYFGVLASGTPMKKEVYDKNGAALCKAFSNIASSGEAEAARSMLSSVPDKKELLMFAGAAGELPLHVAAASNAAGVIRALLAKAVKPKELLAAKDSKGLTAFEYANKRGCLSAALVLREFDALYNYRFPSHTKTCTVEIATYVEPEAAPQ